ncbi:MAG: transposase [Desulfamplus sp.]|nr:transposase [Desulfamplus sp.]
MAYSSDLRHKIVQAYENKQGSISQLSKIFGVGKDTVYRFIKRYKTTGGLSAKRRTTGGNPAKITDIEAHFLKQLLKQKPDLTLSKLCEEFTAHFARSIGISSMHRGLRKYKITLKKNFSRPKEEIS